VKVSVKGLKF